MGEASNDFLSLKPFIYIGLVSYSLYLWHQPIFVFFRFIKHEHIRVEQLLLLIVISLLLSHFNFRFVEAEFRKGNLNKFALS